MLLVAGATVLMMEVGGHGVAMLFYGDRPGGDDGRWLVPLWETTTRREHYTMFSWLHLRDLLNQQALVAPVVLPALLLGWLGTLQRSTGLDQRQRTQSIGRFLCWAAGAHLLLVCLWNPDFGGQRDWDLFSLAAIPTTLLLIWQVPRWFPEPGWQRLAIWPLIAVQALHTGAWIYQNQLPWQWP